MSLVETAVVLLLAAAMTLYGRAACDRYERRRITSSAGGNGECAWREERETSVETS